MLFSGQRSENLARGILLLMLGGFATFGVLRPLLRPYAYSDFATFYSAARAFDAGTTPYELADLQRRGEADFGGWIGRYLYPPPFAAAVVRPLATLPFEVARRIWVLFEAAAYLGALALLVRVVFGSPTPTTLAMMAALSLAWAPIYLDLKLGSVSGLLLLLLVLFLRAYQRRHAWRAAAALAAAVLLKVSPALLVAVLFVRGDRGLVFRTVAAATAIAIATLPWSGVQAWGDYLAHVVPVLANGNFSWFTNQSLDAFFWRLFVPNPDTTPWVASRTLYSVATVVTSAAIVVALAGLARRRPHRDAGGDTDWLVATTLVAALLVARVTWEYMTVLALPCFALCLREVRRGTVRRRDVVVLAIAWALCALPFPYTQAPLRQGAGILLEAPRLYGLAIVLVWSLRHAWTGGAPRPSQPD